MTRKEFIRYLKEKKVFYSFIKNIKSETSFWHLLRIRIPIWDHDVNNKNILIVIDFYAKCNILSKLISGAFPWDSTKEGYNFWLSIHNELLKIESCEKNIKNFHADSSS